MKTYWLLSMILRFRLERWRLKPQGSDAGHNGLKSIQDLIGTEYPVYVLVLPVIFQRMSG